MSSDQITSVSIVVPVYNTPSSMLDRAMRSILTQSLADFEVVLVDDGSTFDCASLCDTYASLDSRVRVIHQSNGGVSSARNAGIEAARSSWVMFVDPDDEILPGVLEEAVDLANRNNLDVLYATEIDVRAGSKQRRKMNFDPSSPLKVIDSRSDLNRLAEYFVSYEVPCDSGIPKALSVGPVARLFRRDVISDVRFNACLSVLEDAVFNSGVALNARRVGLLDKAWYIYYLNSGSATNSMVFDSNLQLQADAVRSIVEQEGLPINAYYSWTCTIFFMTVSTLSIRKLLTIEMLKEAYSMPCFNEAFACLDRSKYVYGTSFSRLKYQLACSKRLRLLYLLYRVRNLLNKVKQPIIQR